MRFMRLPSPSRSAFSSDPIAGMGDRVPPRVLPSQGPQIPAPSLIRRVPLAGGAERRRLDLPEVAVAPPRPHHVLRSLRLTHAFEGRSAAQRRLAVDLEHAPVAGRRALDVVAAQPR